MTDTLNFIGGGRVAKTLGRLWADRGRLRPGLILTRTSETARDAAAFIGGGRGIDTMDAFEAAGFWLIATPDEGIEPAAQRLAQSGKIRAGDVVFHCSGALSSRSLEALALQGARTASVHPMHSFADPLDSQTSFSGTYCALEGEPAALSALSGLFREIGAHTFEIQAEAKTLYHAGSVLASNCLVALIELSLEVLAAAGIGRDEAAALIAPIVHATADNTLHKGAIRSLTGPVSRGEVEVIQAQLEALTQQDSAAVAVYRALGSVAVRIARQQGGPASEERLELIERLFEAQTR